jgi:Putative Flp pilus-assembly TadE/G-like
MHRHERGQVLIITAAGLFVLLGIAALAIDLGFSWMLRRQEQNAADPAAIAAARYLRTELGDPTWDPNAAAADACFYAQRNGFFEVDAGCAAALANGDLQVHAPPVSGPYSGRSGFVQIIITARHPTMFARIFGQDELTVTTSAVAANSAGNSNSSSLVALQPTCSAGSAGDADGGGTINIFPVSPGIEGGYVHVNSICGGSSDDVCGGTGSSALSISGTLRAPFTYTVGSCTERGSGVGHDCSGPVTPCLDEGAVPLGDPLASLPEPRLSAFPNGICPDGSESTPTSTSGCDLRRGPDCPADPSDSAIDVCTLGPGVYYGGWSVGSRVALKLEPGMYILAGGGISLSGGSASIEAVTSPTGVDARITIFSTDGPGCPSIAAQCQGAVRFQASQAFRAKATNAATCGVVTPQACPWKGILLWQDGTASNPDQPVHLGGQSSTILAGTIYAPKAQVEVSGGSATTGCASGPTSGCLAIQIISWRWKVTGGGVIDMPYDPAELYQLDQRGLVH